MKITKSYLKQIILEQLQKIKETNNYWRTRYLVQQAFEKSNKEKEKEEKPESSEEDDKNKKSDKTDKNKK